IYLPASAASDVQTNVDAGLGSDPCAPPTAGAAGLVEAADAISCLDADDDGYESASCGGLDCGDGDALVSPNATEICNGIDDDCDGETDEEPSDGSLCPVANELCQEGACVTQTPPPASELGLHGGLCSLKGPYPGATTRSTRDRYPTSWAWFVGLVSIFLAFRCTPRP
ncbi:MAG: putative metal-binding motif-containing protein, partial [Polyangiaceae bacterium]